MKELNNKLTNGYYIITALQPADKLKTRDKDYISAGTINWLTQVSFEPTIIAIAVGQKSHLNETINYSERFTVHVLNKSNESMVEAFSQDSEIKENSINGFPFKEVKNQIILSNVESYYSCEVISHQHVGDHFVYFGKVTAATIQKDSNEVLSTVEKPSAYRPQIASI